MDITGLIIALAVLAIVAVLIRYYGPQLGLPGVVMQVVNIVIVAAFLIIVVKFLLPFLVAL